MADIITKIDSDDGIDRRGFLKCMAWAGTGVLWSLSGGVPISTTLGRGGSRLLDKNELFFVQISDSHIGFDKPANTDVTATLSEAIARINALPVQPEFLIHTGDISQLSKPSEFDTAQQVITGARTRTGHVFYVPGEHDVLNDAGAAYRQRFAPKARGDGWYSFDARGVHFIGLVNVQGLKPGGLGALGAAQLEWLERDVRRLAASTPIVVFAHVPLWSVYPAWGWGTDDAAQALGYLKRFGSVTVLNGHIHQVLQKVEGNVAFHTAMSTAFPQPAPGTAAGPGPLKVDASRLRDVLGITRATFVPHAHSLAVVDATLSGAAPMAMAAAQTPDARPARADSAVAPNTIRIDNFSFTPPALTVSGGTTVTWRNQDDVPHQIVSADGKFKPSTVLDTGQQFAHAFATPGQYKYYCSIHPTMTGTVEVR